MVIANMPALTEKLAVPDARSVYSGLGVSQRHGTYSIEHSTGLVRTGENYYDSKAGIPEDLRMSTAGEELAMQLALEKAGVDPRSKEARLFDDLFGRNTPQWYAFQWTETGLRVPKGRKADAYETDSQGRKYWPRIVLIGDQEAGEMLVPEGGVRVVPRSANPEEVWDFVFGIPRVTSNEDGDMKYDNHTTHFWFNSAPSKDSKSGQYDVAVARGGDWPHGGPDGCLDVDADGGRWDAPSDDGFRPVRGSSPEGPKIEREPARINPRDVEESLLERVRADADKLTLRQFVKKYNL